MECPRCESELTVYTLSGHEAVVCESCGYVGLPADHLPEKREDETWEEALRRFHGVDDEDAETDVESGGGRGTDGRHRRRRRRRRLKRRRRRQRRRAGR